ncbi:Poly(A) RNA polymerase GLD2 [Echinococcus granulosus]|uniref:Poly(A) RNA polymerase GLD2 n=1 Tax=Echinococcus granulosus TaxID=6210 RepID=W6U3H4_ECHGR|nr:Poly(A) RNA polymerase GLD2 [Echinococcus granulosus]EUB55116.1 Poly(A) RNA polymerase GLD2 [Echinococcus granulosus]
MSEMFMRSRYDPTANTSNLLSSRLEKFFRDNRQTINSYENKVRLKDRLLSTLSPVFPSEFGLNWFIDAKLFIVGSSANGFGWDQSDLDLCLVIAPEEVRSKGGDQPVLEQLTPFLRGCCFITRCMLIPAKVPILKLRCRIWSFDCDLNVNNVVGIYNTHLLAMYARVDPRVPPLGVFVKHWAQMMDIHGGSMGRLSTYALLLMVIQYLQCGCSPPVVPNLQARFPKIFDCARPLEEVDMNAELPWDELRSANRSTLGELFAGFIVYYTTFDFARWAISIRNGRPLATNVAIQRLPSNEQACKIFVEEPCGKGNVAHTVSDEAVFGAIQRAFKYSASVLHNLNLQDSF